MATWQGAWLDNGSGLSQISYYEGDFVSYGNIVYIATGDALLGSVAPPLDMGNWDVMITGTINNGAEQKTGLALDFITQKVYNTSTSPGTGNITNDLSSAQLGIVQKVYHNHSIAPSMPAGWVLVGEGFYVPGTLNIIYAEWCGGTRVEYWVNQ
jgi:hypothetical protein